ncbi:hypothetical protein A8C56_16235 [Niabella ginsenosidivorans]|uniref:Uncharacterized protein n=1 Tax=Niabella ginsenosidivorans TaxID=1176587 RepID=A0A1A9I6M2_9BACT|nr:hypothetical protein [Niabella ginsenosidivorans]ANH82302.1 hypothetical protein A8C56_16235 [Niabella ginsenosidivorans]
MATITNTDTNAADSHPAPKASGYSLLATAISGVIAGSALIYLAYRVGPAPDIYPITYLICIFGYITGWIIAIISTPMNKYDETDLGKFTKLLGSFLTGYILSKCDKLLETILDTSNVFMTITGARLLLFSCCFGLTFILVFYYRRYKWRFNR